MTIKTNERILYKKSNKARLLAVLLVVITMFLIIPLNKESIVFLGVILLMICFAKMNNFVVIEKNGCRIGYFQKFLWNEIKRIEIKELLGTRRLVIICHEKSYAISDKLINFENFYKYIESKIPQS